MFNNKALFEYIEAVLDDSGGDGGAIVVFKQQKVKDVAQEYELWMAEKFPTDECLRLKRVDSPEEREIEFSDNSNENVLFREWGNYERFLRGDSPTLDPVNGPAPTHSDHRHWDTTIVTW